MIEIAPKTAGVTRGFIGIKEDDFDKVFEAYILSLENGEALSNLGKLWIQRLEGEANPEKISRKARDVFEGFARGFETFAKEKGYAWQVKNDHKESQSAFNLRNSVSNPTQNFKATNCYRRCKERFGEKIADIVAVFYNLCKLRSRRKANRETLKEVFALKFAGLIGFQVPESSIVVKRYQDGFEKLTVSTRWNNELIAKGKSSEVETAGRYLAPFLVMGDYDMIGSKLQNTSQIRREDGGTDLFTFDCGHAFGNKKITNIENFIEKDDPSALLGLVNIYSALPQSWFTQEQQTVIGKIKAQFEGNGKYSEYGKFLIQTEARGSNETLLESFKKDIQSLKQENKLKASDHYIDYLVSFESKIRAGSQLAFEMIVEHNADLIKKMLPDVDLSPLLPKSKCDDSVFLRQQEDLVNEGIVCNL